MLPKEPEMGEREQMPIHAVGNSRKLPSPKGIALAIIEACRREDVDMSEVARLVQSDPAMSGRVLRLANSAAYAGRPLVSLREAILRIGLVTVRQVTLGFSLVDQHLNGPCEAFDYPAFWSHSLLMALTARELATRSGVGRPDELFACGLLARIGYLALATQHPSEYSRALQAARQDGASLAALERQLLHTDHNEVTAQLLSHYGIPRAFAEPIQFHEDPGESGFTEGSRPYLLLHLFFLARRVADLGLESPTQWSALTSELMLLGGKIGLDAGDLGEMIDRIVADWQDWSPLFRVPVRDLPPFEKMTKAAADIRDDTSKASSLRVLVVEDEPTNRVLLEGILAKLGYQTYSAVNGREALAMALDVLPHVVVTDWVMPVMDGVEFCRALRSTEWGQTMYLIMLTGVDTDENLVEAFETGVDDYVTKPINVRALSARLRAATHYVNLLQAWELDRARLTQFAAELAVTNRKLEHNSLTDTLTGLPNRRAGMNTLAAAWSAADRSEQPLSVMMIDVDRFKSINDTYGHAVGDQVLIEVSAAIRSVARTDDHLSRMGGEEFLVVCRSSDSRAVLVAAERMRQTVRSLEIQHGGRSISVTASIGIASRESTILDYDALVIAADRALYAAKDAGRDRVCITTGGQSICPSDGPQPLGKR